MKAVTIARTGGPEVLEVQSPTPSPAQGRFVRVKAAGVNFADILMRAFTPAPRDFRPRLQAAGSSTNWGRARGSEKEAVVAPAISGYAAAHRPGRRVFLPKGKSFQPPPR